MELFALFLPYLNYACRDVCPPGDLIVGDLALTKVQEKITKMNIVDHVN